MYVCVDAPCKVLAKCCNLVLTSQPYDCQKGTWFYILFNGKYVEKSLHKKKCINAYKINSQLKPNMMERFLVLSGLKSALGRFKNVSIVLIFKHISFLLMTLVPFFLFCLLD